ncbi:MAG TPA: hypothetical protein VHF24_02780 [Acidimicrobiales bacterium]|nr:hypothetical protein [Acidimicrobiales bacterium]
MTEDDLEGLEVSHSFNLMKDPPVAFPGVPGAAIPRRFTGAVRDPANGCKAQLEVEIHDGRPRLRSFTVVTEDDPLTPTDLRRLPIGSYLDVVVSSAILRSQRSPGGDVILSPITDFNEAVTITKAGKAARRRRPVTRERLEAVAAAYRGAPPRQTSEYVAEQLGVGEGYARQLIHRARKANLLPAKGDE